MGFGGNHTLQRVAVEAMFDGSSQRLHVAPGVVAADDGVPNAVQEAGAPLRAEACSPGASGFGDPFVVLHVLSYRDLPRLPTAHLVVHPLQQAPAVGNIGTGIVVAAPDIADPADSVEPQTVAIALLEPAQDIVA